MPDSISVWLLMNSTSQSWGQVIDLHTIYRIKNDFSHYIGQLESPISDYLAHASVTDDERAHWDEVERIAPSNEDLRASVVRFPAPPEWLEESEQPFL